MDPIKDVVRRIRASRDPEEIRRLRVVLRERLAPPPAADPAPAAPAVPVPADSLAEVHRLEREQWGKVPGRVGARMRNGMLVVVTPWRD
jgi:hypothetical protein